MLTPRNLDFWIKNHFNVLVSGKHGVGKTSIVKEAFERNGLKWLYFSCATMDPWVDFVGIPREQKDDSGKPYLDLVRPKPFQDDCVEAIFFDEFNRAPKKVRNAVMELLQYKSINGHKFKNLKIICAAINPDDSNYDVDPLDLAQQDRFQIHVEMPYQCDFEYFADKYGDDTARSAIEWWNQLSDESKNLCSPRRLDYALQVHFAGGDIYSVIDRRLNTSQLIEYLNFGLIEDKIMTLCDKGDINTAKEYFKNTNYLMRATKFIVKSEKYLKFFLPLMPEEYIVKLLYENVAVESIVKNNIDKEPYKSIITNIVQNTQSGYLYSEIKRMIISEYIQTRDVMQVPDSIWKLINDWFGKDQNPKTLEFGPSNADFQTMEDKVQGCNLQTISGCINAIETIAKYIPQNITKEQAIRLLKTIDAKISTKFTNIPECPNYIPVINHCLIAIENSDNCQWRTAVKVLLNCCNIWTKILASHEQNQLPFPF